MKIIQEINSPKGEKTRITEGPLPLGSLLLIEGKGWVASRSGETVGKVSGWDGEVGWELVPAPATAADPAADLLDRVRNIGVAAGLIPAGQVFDYRRANGAVEQIAVGVNFSWPLAPHLGGEAVTLRVGQDLDPDWAAKVAAREQSASQAASKMAEIVANQQANQQFSEEIASRIQSGELLHKWSEIDRRGKVVSLLGKVIASSVGVSAVENYHHRGNTTTRLSGGEANSPTTKFFFSIAK